MAITRMRVRIKLRMKTRIQFIYMLSVMSVFTICFAVCIQKWFMHRYSNEFRPKCTVISFMKFAASLASAIMLMDIKVATI